MVQRLLTCQSCQSRQATTTRGFGAGRVFTMQGRVFSDRTACHKWAAKQRPAKEDRLVLACSKCPVSRKSRRRAIRWGHVAKELGVTLPALRAAIETETAAGVAMRAARSVGALGGRRGVLGVLPALDTTFKLGEAAVYVTHGRVSAAICRHKTPARARVTVTLIAASESRSDIRSQFNTLV